MTTYVSPQRDIEFLLKEFLNIEQLAKFAPYGELSEDLVDAIVTEVGKLASEQLNPCNSTGDEQGCQYDPETFSVKTPDGFKEAYKAYAEGGWTGLSAPTEFGGQGLPHTLNVVLEELSCSANLSLSMYPGLTQGAVSAIYNHGEQALKDTYLEKMIDGTWSGTMCLTEPQCGTDLGLIRTKAEPDADGSYKISGTKIWITGGEHDLTENIIHLVLAKLPDAPAGTKGISLFLVPKFLPDSAERNSAFCGGLEHKMGIKGSATCVMNFEQAKGWLVGSPHDGMRCMFTMMNAARLMVGVQGLSIAEYAYQIARDFAKERLQSRSISGAKHPDKPADPIIVHADVKRMLLRQKVLNEGMRALAYWTGLQLDLAHCHDNAEAKQEADDFVQLLTPIVKAFLTDEGFANANHALQVLGGSGFTSDWKIEQLVRDVRITRIYEGTNGIQALDLVGRKLRMHNGRYVRAFFAKVEAFMGEHPDHAHLAELKQAMKVLQNATTWLAMNAMKNPEHAGAAASTYLRIFALSALSWIWAQQETLAQAQLDTGTEDEAFYAGKVKSAMFFYRHVLPEITSLEQELTVGVDAIQAFDEADF